MDCIAVYNMAPTVCGVGPSHVMISSWTLWRWTALDSRWTSRVNSNILAGLSGFNQTSLNLTCTSGDANGNEMWSVREWQERGTKYRPLLCINTHFSHAIWPFQCVTRFCQESDTHVKDVKMQTERWLAWLSVCVGWWVGGGIYSFNIKIFDLKIIFIFF